MLFKIFNSILIAVCVQATYSFAQNTPADSSLYSDNAKEVISYFNVKIAEQAPLYNGDKYEPFSPHAVKGTVYFNDKSICTPSLICFNGVWYKNIPVLYDIYNSNMVSSLNGNLFILNAEKLSDIFLLGHHFVYINEANGHNLTAGYYDLAYNGNTTVLIKRSKEANENVVGSQTVEVTYADKEEVWVKKNGSFFLVDGNSAIADLFKDKKKELKKYQHEMKLDYSADKEAWAIGLAQYYDSINK